MSIPFLSVQGLSGGMELGIIQSSDEFELVHRTGSLDLGAPVVEANRKLVGWSWEGNYTDDPKKLHVVDVPFISANPPCSAFSTLTRKDLRGTDAKVMSCTDEVFDYAMMMKTPPEIIAIESVQQAFSLGRPYYQAKRDLLEEKTGYKYDLVWVMQSNAAVGGASMRRRVFVCLTRVPFGVEYAQPTRVAHLGEAIRDLEGLALTAEKQPYRRPATWWSGARRAPDGVDGHFTVKSSPWFQEILDKLDQIGEEWTLGDGVEFALRKLYKAGVELPHEWQRNIQKHAARDFKLGINQTTRWNPDKLGPVVTGSGPNMSVHYTEHRLLTHRECFRIQGFPDTWRLWPVREYKKLGACPGKGVPVDAGRWLGTWVKQALDRDPGTVQGEIIGDRERKIDITHSYKWTLSADAPWRFSKNTLHNSLHVQEYASDL